MRVRIGPGREEIDAHVGGCGLRRIGARQRFERRLGDGVRTPIGQRLRRDAGGDEHHAAGVGGFQQRIQWRR